MNRRPDLTTAAWRKLRTHVLNRDGWQCTSCGTPVEGKNAHVDHILPFTTVEESNHMHNLVTLCASCNGAKQDRIQYRLNWVNPRYLTHV